MQIILFSFDINFSAFALLGTKLLADKYTTLMFFCLLQIFNMTFGTILDCNKLNSEHVTYLHYTFFALRYIHVTIYICSLCR